MPGSDGTNMLTEMTASALSRMTVARCGAVRAEGGIGNTRRERGTKKAPDLVRGRTERKPASLPVQAPSSLSYGFQRHADCYQAFDLTLWQIAGPATGRAWCRER